MERIHLLLIRIIFNGSTEDRKNMDTRAVVTSQEELDEILENKEEKFALFE